jgi:hypothetical protein
VIDEAERLLQTFRPLSALRGIPVSTLQSPDLTAPRADEQLIGAADHAANLKHHILWQGHFYELDKLRIGWHLQGLLRGIRRGFLWQ